MSGKTGPLSGKTGPLSGKTVVHDGGFAPLSDLGDGEVIAGRFEVVRELGRGGMGQVLLVRDRLLKGQEVALKLISPELVALPEAQDRFAQEVLAARLLSHPNIVKVHDSHEFEGRRFFTMEYVSGRSLRELLEERRGADQVFKFEEALSLLLPVLDALGHAHGQGVIHRDLKPDNVVVTGEYPGWRVKVLDFGLAKMLSPSKLTSSALSMGTAYYMSPEQLSASRDVGPASDIYSVGVVLYELLTGKVPQGRFRLPGEVMPGLPPEIDEVIDKALQAEAGDRYQTAGELVEALGRVLEPGHRVAEEGGLAGGEAAPSEGALGNGPASGQEHFTNSVGMEFALIPAGSFMMGSPESDEDGYEGERPQHRVEITKPFYLGVTEVTQGQWKAVMGSNPSFFKGDEGFPVEGVSWEEAVEFTRRLNKEEGLKAGTYRLPTEGEWEYACRAGSSTRYSFGDSESALGEYGWYDDNSGGRTHPVGEKEPNAWGLYDMHGNVWEWVSDWYGSYSASPTRDPQGPSSGSGRVIRGGSWRHNPRSLRSANRFRSDPTSRDFDVGFRVARILTP
ncbi:MAG: bifunctional serine/threonine-protein kinase/formylglycine-generating enzyme family protein [Thermodesulfobacteriota bacterium]